MPYLMNSKQFENVTKLDPDQRYEYAIKRVADWAELWVSDRSSGNQSTDIPIAIWPHPNFAEMYVGKGSKPQRIEVHDWLDNWVPELERTRRLVSVFPLEVAGKIVTANRLKSDLKAELSKIED